MKRLEIKKAAHGAVALISPKFASNGASDNGLSVKDTGGRFACLGIRIARLRDDYADGSERLRSSANMPLLLLSKRCEGDSSRNYRRMTAAPFLDLVAAILLGGIRASHGLSAPALYRFCGLMPGGRLLRLPCPIARSVNPLGVALLLTGVGGFRQLAIGACHE